MLLLLIAGSCVLSLISQVRRLQAARRKQGGDGGGAGENTGQDHGPLPLHPRSV